MRSIKKHLSKVLTLGAYGYQAVTALALVLAVGHSLPPSEYARFSLTMATSQFIAIGAFEWVRIASTRFYPGLEGDGGQRRLSNILASFLCSSVIAIIAALALGRYRGELIVVSALSLAISFGQGVTDLQLTRCRFRSAFHLFSRLQAMRASLLLLGGLAGAKLYGTAIGALTGIVAAYAITLISALIFDRAFRSLRFELVSRGEMARYFSYGVPAATASVMHLGAILILRYVISALALPNSVPGSLMAIDVMQRPFVVIATALHGIFYPPVVKAFDRGGVRALKVPLDRLRKIEISALVGLAIILAGVMPLLSPYFVPSSMQSAFLMTSLAATATFSLRSALVNIAPIKAHLFIRTRTIAAVGGADIALTVGFLSLVYLLKIRSVPVIVLAHAASAGVAIIFAARIQRGISPSGGGEGATVSVV